MVRDNMALAHFFARKFAWSLGDNEALSIAMEGLLNAARDWDSQGCKFGTYASLRIKWTFSLKFRKGLRKRAGGRIPHVSLDAPVEDGANLTVGDCIFDPAAGRANDLVETEQEVRDVEGLLGCLSEKQRLILQMRFGIDRRRATLEATGRALGLTRERIRQLQNEAIHKLNKIRFNRDPVKGAVREMGVPKHLWGRLAAKPSEKRGRPSLKSLPAKRPNFHAAKITDYYARNQLSRRTGRPGSTIEAAEIEAFRRTLIAKRLRRGRTAEGEFLRAVA